MESQLKRAAPAKTAASKYVISNCNTKVRKGTKEYSVLSALVEGRSFNRFEAARELSDWCLHSTVSTLQGKGILIHREFEKVPCLGGDKTTDVMRYRLLPDQLNIGRALLGLDQGRVDP